MFRFFTVSLFTGILLFFGAGCNSKGLFSGPLKIGVDPYWYPINFGMQNSYVNGFVEEFLLDVAQQNKLEFERITANWDNLLEGLKQGRYQAILSSLPPHEFNLNLYDFSHNFLDLGPVLIVPEGSAKNSLDKMSSEHIGVIVGDPAVLLLQKYEGLMVRNYPTAPDLLEALSQGEIEGVLLDRVLAGSYVTDLFSKKLKIAGPPLSDAGLHLIVLKGKQSVLLAQFNKSINILKKKKRMSVLIKKWRLGEI
ncbi:MAG TPA: transporter substrate-binding domain-containing protein [Chlamydiales bacterium]|nr:transporter substrate-binding domain-containing protein [Chlamydiales bacterium]